MREGTSVFLWKPADVVKERWDIRPWLRKDWRFMCIVGLNERSDDTIR